MTSSTFLSLSLLWFLKHATNPTTDNTNLFLWQSASPHALGRVAAAAQTPVRSRKKKKKPPLGQASGTNDSDDMSPCAVCRQVCGPCTMHAVGNGVTRPAVHQVCRGLCMHATSEAVRSVSSVLSSHLHWWFQQSPAAAAAAATDFLILLFFFLLCREPAEPCAAAL